MGRKEEANKSSSRGGQEDIKSDQKLQAIILADSFEKNFRPISLDRPKVLLPLVNAPMLNYTVEFLAQNGIEELFIFCVWHAEMLQEYINSTKWPGKMSIRCITSTACTSAGDALRELDSLGVIRSDTFILISGDVVSNIDLKKAIKFHQERRKADPNAIMTVALKAVQPNAAIRNVMDDLVCAIDNKTSQIVLFDDAYSNSDVNIPMEIIKEHHNISFHANLLDCHVDICSPEVMLQFSDNFDYQDIRRDFIRNEVVNWELGMHIYGYLIEDEYAARVHDPRTYHSISRDIVTRWVYPIVPDSEFMPGTNYVLNKNYNYLERDCQIARSARIGECNVIDRGCSIGDKAFVDKSTLGAFCRIGDKCKIVDSHLWDDCIVESGAVVDQSIICSGAVIKKGAIVSAGCVISFGVVIGEGVTVPPFTRITAHEDGKIDHAVVGADGKGELWRRDAEEDDDMKGVKHSIAKEQILEGHSMGCKGMEKWRKERWNTLPIPVNDDDSDLDTDDYDDEDDMGSSSRANHNESFEGIMEDMIVSGYTEKNPADKVLLELKGNKFSQNRTFSDCIHAVVGPLLSVCAPTPDIPFNQLLKNLMSNFKEDDSWAIIILKGLIQNEDDELEAIRAMEDFITEPEHKPVFYKAFRYVLQMLYELDLLSQEALSEWIDERRSSEKVDERVALFREKEVQAFVEMLEESSDAESGSDEDDEEDESEGEEDEEEDEED